HQVSKLPGTTDATLFVHAHYQCGRPRCHAQNFSRSDPGAYIKLEFVVERVSGEGIGSWNNRDARVMNCLEQTQHSRESVVISRLFIGRNFERATAHRPPYLRRKARHDFFQAGRSRAWIAAKERFIRVHCWIEYGVMLPKKIDELAHHGFVRR